MKHHSSGRLPEAEKIYQQILQADPGHPIALHLLGVIAHQRGKNDVAVDLISKALTIMPEYAEAHNNLGNALKKLGKLDEAIVSYHKALAIAPEYAGAHNNLGNVLQDQGKLDEAIASFRTALTIKPDFADAHYNLGTALRDLGKLDEAVASYHQALAIKPDFAEAHNNLGNALKELGELDEAVANYHKALAIKPDSSLAHSNLGIPQLLMGDFQDGWENYAWRWRVKDFRLRPRDYKEPFWDGSALEGKTIFIYPEQGYGDTIQFARYLPLVAVLGARVVFEVPETLYRLFKGSKFAGNLVGTKETPPPFDCHIPLLDVPRLLNTTLETIPSCDSFLKALPELQKEWADRICPSENIRLGIVWATPSKRTTTTALSRGPFSGHSPKYLVCPCIAFRLEKTANRHCFSMIKQPT